MITVKEIARLAGVSPKTAERALAGTTKGIRRDARERAERVRRIAEARGYRPSELALALRRGRVQTIGFMTDILTDQFLAAAVETAMDEAAKIGYKIALQVVRFDRELTAAALKGLLASGVEGVITSCRFDQLPPELMRTLKEQKYPFFTLCGRNGAGFSAAMPDYSEALPAAVNSLAAKGHKRITLCLFEGKEVDNAANFRLFRECCFRCGAEPDCRLHGDRRQAVLPAEEKLPAVILYGKYSMRIFQDRCAELGHRPDAVGIYNEWTFASAQAFGLHGIVLEQGEKSVRAAVRQIAAEIGGKEPRCIALPARYVTGAELRTLKVPDLANQMLFDQQ